MTTILLAGGGSAGHIEPALATGDALRRIDPALTILALGTPKGLEGRLVPQRGYELVLIPPVPLPRKVSADLLKVPGRLAGTVRRTRRILSERQVDLVIGFGGYVSLPAYLAAGRRVPVVIHEANARPGLANRIGARRAAAVASATPDCPLPGARYLGIPLRPAIAGLDRLAARPAARAEFGLDPDRPTVLVFGGSQGAARINAAVLGAAGRITGAGAQILHAAGESKIDDVRRDAPDDPNYHPVAYLDDMAAAYAAADLVVGRSGAMTCAELAAVGLPAVYVPYPVGNGEQRLNARPVVDAGGGLLIDDADLTADRLAHTVTELLADPARLAAMGQAASTHGRRHADGELAQLALDVLARAGKEKR